MTKFCERVKIGYMRKNKRGRIPKYDKEVIRLLRDKSNLSFQEIADRLKMKSRQLARYYYLKAIEKLDKKL